MKSIIYCDNPHLFILLKFILWNIYCWFSRNFCLFHSKRLHIAKFKSVSRHALQRGKGLWINPMSGWIILTINHSQWNDAEKNLNQDTADIRCNIPLTPSGIVHEYGCILSPKIFHFPVYETASKNRKKDENIVIMLLYFFIWKECAEF